MMTPGDLATIFNLPRAHTAIAEWLFALLYILPQKKRLGKLGTAGISVGYFVLLMALNKVGEFQGPVLWMVFMILCMVAMLLFIFTACNVSMKRALYYWSQAFLIAEFAASLEWQLNWYILHTLKLTVVFELVHAAVHNGEYTVLSLAMDDAEHRQRHHIFFHQIVVAPACQQICSRS